MKRLLIVIGAVAACETGEPVQQVGGLEFRMTIAEGRTYATVGCEEDEAVIGGGCTCTQGLLAFSQPFVDDNTGRHLWACGCSEFFDRPDFEVSTVVQATCARSIAP